MSWISGMYLNMLKEELVLESVWYIKSLSSPNPPRIWFTAYFPRIVLCGMFSANWTGKITHLAKPNPFCHGEISLPQACISYFSKLVTNFHHHVQVSPEDCAKQKNQNSCTALMMTSVVRKRLCTHIHKSSWYMSINNSLVTAEKYWCLSNLMSFPEEICWFAVLNLG